MVVQVLLAIAIFVTFILLGVAGIYALDGAVNITRIKDYKKVQGLSSAHTILSWVGSLIVVGMILLIAGVILLFVTGIGEILLVAGIDVLVGMIFVILALVCVGCGIAAIFASVYIHSTYNKDDEPDVANRKRLAYRDAVVTAVCTLVPTLLVIIIIVTYYLVDRQHKRRLKKKDQQFLRDFGEKVRETKVAELPPSDSLMDFL